MSLIFILSSRLVVFAARMLKFPFMHDLVHNEGCYLVLQSSDLEV